MGEGCLQVLYIFVLCAGKKPIFDGKVVETLARNTNIYNICKLRGTRFSAFHNSSRPNFAILLIKI